MAQEIEQTFDRSRPPMAGPSRSVSTSPMLRVDGLTPVTVNNRLTAAGARTSQSRPVPSSGRAGTGIREPSLNVRVADVT